MRMATNPGTRGRTAMARRPTAAWLGVLAATASGCATQATTFVDSDDSALGRVVVYRNGIAYYERKAHVVGTHLTLTVPADKVDDFLKSLTVADAVTGDALPVSFPTRGAAEADLYHRLAGLEAQLPPGHRARRQGQPAGLGHRRQHVGRGLERGPRRGGIELGALVPL